ncbi:MAG: Tex family protein [Pseudomonadota bacterium]|nr:Tex family protein [Pseudomonadota bacterium]
MTEHTLPAHILKQLAQELEVKENQVTAAVNLLDEGATVPFIARYRKEVTQGLTDTHLRQLEERLDYMRDLQSQKETALKTIKELDKLTPALEKQINEAMTKQVLADLYQPYRPKRRSKATQAIEAGLEPLATDIWSNRELNPEEFAQKFINEEKGITTVKQALEGAQHILAEKWSDDPVVVQPLREQMRTEAHIISKAKNAPAEKTTGDAEKDKALAKKRDQFEKKAAKFNDYLQHSEGVGAIASHRILALFRGRRENVLDLTVDLPEVEKGQKHPCVSKMHQILEFTPEGKPADAWLEKVVNWTWRVKLHTKLENDLMSEIKEKADQDSINVFARNLKNLLLSAPAGTKATIGLDPGIRTGVKVAVVGETGQVLEHTTIYPHAPKNQWDEAKAALKAICEKFTIQLIAIGNGTASRETDKLVAEFIRENPDFHVKKAMVSEAGASVYSASEYASKELPDLDVAIRGAVSIARRLQDPLAELVKIEPKSIGVGQYQHDVSQPKLAKSLDTVVIDCVNSVGVDLNTASEPLLARISGLNDTIAQNIVAFRQEQGAFKDRATLKKIPRLGQRTFEQAAGFLRIPQGENPLDATAVHPESYELVATMAASLGKEVKDIIGQKELLSQLNPADFVTENLGELTIKDVIEELEKPGRDPRPEFSTVEFRDDVHEIKDLKQGMILDGIVTNVTNFGAFVDVGVHQDGLVHISALTDKFVSDPHSIVKAGDTVKVKVLNADVDRNRIDLSMRLADAPAKQNKPQGERNDTRSKGRPQQKRSGKPKKEQFAQPKQEKALPPGKTGTFADLFAQLKS